MPAISVAANGDTDQRQRHYTIAAAETFLVFLIALAARLPHLDHVPFKDELNHVLAARALLETGTLEILPGAQPYDRAWGFTYLVAGMFRWFGESLVVGRVPALVAGAILVALLFVWVRSEAGRLGAWAAALLLAFSPVSLMLSQWVRFYTLHALLFFVAAVAVYRLATVPRADRNQRVLLGGVAVLSLLVALHLQITTIIGIAGLLLWLVIVGTPPLWARLSSERSRVYAVAVAGGVVALVAVGVWITGLGEWMYSRAMRSPDWAADGRQQLRYYHFIFLEQYPTLWTLAPLAFLVALASRARAALLCACIFGVAFLSHSVAAWKAERYLFYALPMFFALWGLAIGGALPWLRERSAAALDSLRRMAVPRLVRAAAVGSVLAAALLFVIAGSAATSYSIKYMTVGDADWQGWGGYRGHPDWEAAGLALADELRNSEVVLASYDISALYGIGRADYLLRHLDVRTGDYLNFFPRGKTPVPVVATPEALALVIACHTSGTAIIESTHFRREWATSPEQVDLLEAHADRLELPSRLHVYHWHRDASSSDPAACEEIRTRTDEWRRLMGW
jgi:4-amino-4-deoxy-L-arabinose transferase-like glycosyltransferase